MKSAVALGMLVALLASGACKSNNERDRRESLSAFGSDGDKCTRAWHRMEPLFLDKGLHPDRAGEIARCRTALAQMPGRELWLDCIIEMDDPLTQAKLDQCKAVDQSVMSNQADAQNHILSKRTSGGSN
jgi:hypothetical protein